MTITNQTVTDRIAEKLKSTEFGAWFGEDDLLVLTRDAVNKAFFTNRPNLNKRHYQDPDLPPLIVEYAQQHVAGKINALVKEQVAAYVKENPDVVNEAISKAVAVGIDKIILRVVVDVITGGAQDFAYKMQENITNAIRDRL